MAVAVFCQVAIEGPVVQLPIAVDVVAYLECEAKPKDGTLSDFDLLRAPLDPGLLAAKTIVVLRIAGPAHIEDLAGSGKGLIGEAAGLLRDDTAHVRCVCDRRPTTLLDIDLSTPSSR